MQTTPSARHTPSRSQVRRWRQYLADERAEGDVYRDIASRRTGEEREILLALAEAERRHEQHWLDLLGDDVGRPRSGDLRTRLLGALARRFGSVFVLALAQRAEARSGYDDDADATASMAADEAIHEEVVRGLATRGRNRISGTFRAAVFGANDGLVSNLALVLGIGASGASNATVLLTGLAGLLAGALSMGAGEYVSVRSQRELLEASRPGPAARAALPYLDVDANELALVYRARGMDARAAQAHADEVLGSLGDPDAVHEAEAVDEHESVGTAFGAAAASFCFFASGAAIPVLPYLLGAEGLTAVAWASGLVGLALLATGATVGVLSGGSPAKRALRQLAIGYGAAGATYLLGLAFGATV
ncbi:VIT1/CCC1 transporter family protein [Cellulomonas fengjieae]|uniref:VIT1/CCC1 transporter family protein n=1 Tax=Cellulomonas fengjieae TaxID=2819978 RepID=A0ABS3SHL5_9CELL|nr:VIT1/CCC1 family protein [Cellulomonas fengjieae]MBO3085243.1 VIT1/CCC1 transporter family protein [Cellulomonas fengjieae]MBO3100990.1 VIT1/CCC1 transporter family protein [Cellulomonas fengjieae]QVI66192.1 VIT1/CCC1 transporter family protein [Cellulomonas fengjieae]